MSGPGISTRLKNLVRPGYRRARSIRHDVESQLRTWRHHLLSRPIDLQDLSQILDNLEVADEHLLVVYSSWDDMRLTAKPSDVVDLLRERLADNGILAFPSAPFRGRLFDYLKQVPTFDLRRSPSCRGFLSEVARRHKQAFRTRQPGAPYSLIGRGAQELARSQSDLTSAYSEDSFLAEAHRQNALTLTLGLPWTQNTLMHYVEKRMSDRVAGFSDELLPYRIKDGDEIIEAESEYLLPLERDLTPVRRAIRRSASFRQFRRFDVPYSRVRDQDTYAAYARAITEGAFRPGKSHARDSND